MTSEGDIQARALRALADIGVWAFRVNSGRRGHVRLAPPGTPDICLPAYGWLECKRPGEDLNANQILWHARAEREGVWVRVFESPIEAVELVLERRRELGRVAA